MSFLERLLDGAEVEWKPLGDILVRTKGTKITAGQMKELHKKDAPIKIFAGGRTVAFINYNDIPAKDINIEPSIIVKSRGNIEFEYYEQPFSHKNEMWSYHSNKDAISIKYIYHFLKLNEAYFQNIGSKMQMPQIAIPDTDKFLVPIPCHENPEKSLKIQSEIVRILDKFTAMTAELTAELNTRKKQYNYYRDQLFNFEESEVEWRKLGEVVSIKHGKDWKSLGAGDIPVYGSGGVMQYVDTFAYDKPTVLIPRKGSITNIFYVESPFWNVDTIYYTEIDTKQIIPKFFYYFMKTIDLMQLDTGSGRPSLTQAILNEIKVPIPHLDKQAHIVKVLDKFDALTSSITEGLPREIELRQQQYEYYRDLLFSFPKSETVEA
ncbi:restriction endonuclease subunit S [Acinetobacter baumannii]|nr:restriction endonuclease subunit S [Acinetobacter baumannii]